MEHFLKCLPSFYSNYDDSLVHVPKTEHALQPTMSYSFNLFEAQLKIQNFCTIKLNAFLARFSFLTYFAQPFVNSTVKAECPSPTAFPVLSANRHGNTNFTNTRPSLVADVNETHMLPLKSHYLFAPKRDIEAKFVLWRQRRFYWSSLCEEVIVLQWLVVFDVLVSGLKQFIVGMVGDSDVFGDAHVR